MKCINRIKQSDFFHQIGTQRWHLRAPIKVSLESRDKLFLYCALIFRAIFDNQCHPSPSILSNIAFILWLFRLYGLVHLCSPCRPCALFATLLVPNCELTAKASYLAWH